MHDMLNTRTKFSRGTSSFKGAFRVLPTVVGGCQADQYLEITNHSHIPS